MDILPSVSEIEFSMEGAAGEDIELVSKKLDDKVVEFNNIKATKEELDKMLDEATQDANYLKISFPDNYIINKYIIPRECINSIKVMKVRSKSKRNKEILKTVNAILANKCTQE